MTRRSKAILTTWPIGALAFVGLFEIFRVLFRFVDTIPTEMTQHFGTPLFVGEITQLLVGFPIFIGLIFAFNGILKIVDLATAKLVGPEEPPT
jgi:hypothetical protein